MNRRKKERLAKLADNFGRLKSKVADLEDMVFLLRSQLIQTGESEIEGDLFKVTISSTTKVTVDLPALREAYPDIAKEFERISTAITVRCNSR